MDAQERDLLIRQIARRVQEAGGRAMLVGGCVRDALLCRESGDIDCEVYGLAPDALRAIAGEFGEVDESGARYGVYSRWRARRCGAISPSTPSCATR